MRGVCFKTMSKKIKLTQGKYVIVDNEDYQFVSRLNMFFSKPKINEGNGIIVARFENKNKHLDMPVSNLIMNKKVSGHLFVVPKNSNPFDLRKENLVLANGAHFVHSLSHNYRNTPKTSKYRGVSLQKKGKRWKGSIQKDGVRFQNSFDSEKKAAQFYNKKAKELYGDLAYQNKIK